MSGIVNLQIRLAAHPDGMPGPEHFQVTETREDLAPKRGVRLKTLWLSVDPYQRVRMSGLPSYTEPAKIGDLMPGGTVSEVLSSTDPRFAQGDIVQGYTGWQAYADVEGAGLRKLDPALAPVTTALGVLGMPGMTAYTGLLNIGNPKPGETLVVAAAAGAVGSAVGQIGKLKGCWVVGIAGGPEKCAHLTRDLGFDASVDHRAGDLAGALARACPSGIDIYFENVGGPVWQAVQPLLNNFARVPVCGVIANYNDNSALSRGQSADNLMRFVLYRRLRIQGIIVSDFAAQHDDFLRDMGGWLAEGRIRYREHVVEGLRNAPAALVSLLKGENLGKMLVKA
jgi:hypothetical protein